MRLFFAVPAVRFHHYLHLTSLKLPKISVMALIAITCVLPACDKLHNDPLKQTIPTNSERWEKELAPVMEELSEDDQQTLSRYMLRIKMSNAYEAGALPNISVGDALKQQRAFESNQDNAQLTDNHTSTNPYVLSLSPISQTQIDALQNGQTNTVSLRFMLSNRSNHTLTGFSGNIAVLGADFTEPKRFSVQDVHFEPPILPEQAGKIIIDSPITDINVMRAIKDPANTAIIIEQGTFTLNNQEKVTVTNSLDIK